MVLHRLCMSGLPVPGIGFDTAAHLNRPSHCLWIRQPTCSRRIFRIPREPWRRNGLQFGRVENSRKMRFVRGLLASCWFRDTIMLRRGKIWWRLVARTQSWIASRWSGVPDSRFLGRISHLGQTSLPLVPTQQNLRGEIPGRLIGWLGGKPEQRTSIQGARDSQHLLQQRYTRPYFLAIFLFLTFR